MTQSELEIGARLLAAATPGPWVVQQQRGRGHGMGRMFIRSPKNDYTAIAHICQRVDRDDNAAAIAWLRTHAAELIADAARYQWLRDEDTGGIDISLCGDGDAWTALRGSALDAAIDAARASGAEGA